MLVLEDEITLTTRYGSSKIQLMLGDITHLPVEEKVDVVFTSAFPGDYSCVKGTLIHALFKNLDISVRELARNKESDLTKMFSCWISKPLPPDKPYRRLVCFEVNHNQTLTEQISMMFRACMPTFNGNENTVITPPLATGCQGVPVEQMLGLMVNTACHWIKAGLPLKCLKLVLFARDLESAKNYLYKSSINIFSNLKNKWHAKESQLTISKNVDITFSYHPDDTTKVTDISGTMEREDNSLAIHRDGFKKNEEQSWQDEVFDKMANSKRIVIALTPPFVSDKWCIDQFNLAMCCNRFKGVEMVIPFYLETVDSFPSYMNLIQYQDCRGSKDESEKKILNACKDVIQAVNAEKAASESQNKTTDEMEKKPVPIYDVFISYCHRTSDIAKIAVEVLSTKYPDIKVFFDRSELKTGNIWQQALYEAVDKTRCLVALLSDAYMKSTVCQEEYNIALARLFVKDDFLLVPVCMNELTAFPESYAKTKPVAVSSHKEVEQLIDKIMPTILKLKGIAERKDRETIPIVGILDQQRYLQFSKHFHFDWEAKEIQRINVASDEEDLSKLEARISFSYTSDGVKYAAVLTEMLQQRAPAITCNLLSFNQVDARQEIDNADMVVLFVSNEFLASERHLEELHIALCRQRLAKDRTLIYLVEVSPITEGPYYPSILPFKVGLDDVVWQRLSKAFDFRVKRFNVYHRGLEGTYMCSPTDFSALQTMNLDILRLLSQRGKGTEIQTNLVNVERFKKQIAKREDNDLSPDKIIPIIIGPKIKVAVSVSSYVTPKAMWDDDESVSGSDDDHEVPVTETTSVTDKENKAYSNKTTAPTNPTFITSPYDFESDKCDSGDTAVMETADRYNVEDPNFIVELNGARMDASSQQGVSAAQSLSTEESNKNTKPSRRKSKASTSCNLL